MQIPEWLESGSLRCVLVFGCGSSERNDPCPDTPIVWHGTDYDGFLLSCEAAPQHCDLPVSTVMNEPDLETAIDIVFVADGYTEDLLEAYREHVRTLIDALSADKDGIVGRDPELFNFHRVDLASPDTSVASRPLRSCVSPDASLTGDDALAARAAANAPEADLIIVVVNGSRNSRSVAGQDANGTDIIRISTDVSHRVITHELGHALVGLRDEYVEFPHRHYLADQYERWNANPLAPNLSLSPDEQWEGLVEGSHEGGDRYAQGVYRPTNSCRMIDAYADIIFCPVCSAAIDEFIDGKRGKEDGPPRCGIATGAPRESGPRQVDLFGRDANGLAKVRLRVDGELVSDTAPSSFRPLSSALPRWFKISTGTLGNSSIEITCVDGSGESSNSTLSLQP